MSYFSRPKKHPGPPPATGAFFTHIRTGNTLQYSCLTDEQRKNGRWIVIPQVLAAKVLAWDMGTRRKWARWLMFNKLPRELRLKRRLEREKELAAA